MEQRSSSGLKLTALYTFEGLQRVEVDNAPAGEIIAVAGVESINTV